MGWFDWLTLGAGAVLAPFTGGLSLAAAGAVSGAKAAATGGKKDSSGKGGFFTGNEILPNQTPMLAPGALEPYANWLFSQFSQKPDGGYEMRPLETYPGQLNVDLNNTMLPQIWNQWGQGNPGMDWLNNFLATGGFQPSSALSGGIENTLQQGSAGGRPGQLMENMVQWGGTGGKGHNAIDMMMQYGAPSQVGQPMSNLAQFGITGQAGLPLYNRAWGRPSPGSNWLAAYGGA